MDMKEIKAMDKVYLEKYDVHVNPYLTYAQIQAIVNGVKGLDGWAEREQNIDMCVLAFATDIPTEKLEELGHDALLQSGLINAVMWEIKNLHRVYEAIEYTESTKRALAQIIKALPKYQEQLDAVVKKYGNLTKK
nr:MAG TPA: hypothetical protein [Bacteriophage sp.]